MNEHVDERLPEGVPLGFGEVTAEVGDHIAHFFRGDDQRFSVLGPYIETGLRRDERCIFISSPDTGTALCDWLSNRGVRVDEARSDDRLLLHAGRDSTDAMKELADRLDATTQNEDPPFIRWAGDADWCLDRKITVEEMLHWESLYDEHCSDWRLLALCQFDLTTFESDVIMDALRTHPYCVMGEVVVPNPFHESPEAVRQDLGDSA